MKRINLSACTAVAAMALMLGTMPVQAQDMGSAGGTMKPMSKKAMAKMEPMMRGWPKASRDAVKYMTGKYGAPLHMTQHMALWGKTGQWKRTIVYNYEVKHDFPAPHTDVMQQWIDYRTPLDMFDDLAMYDGSVVADRTGGELSARCDKEGANFLAINLANEIVTGKRSVDDARRMYGEQVMAMMAMKPAPYTERIMFTPMVGGTMDPDRPLK